MSAIFGELLNFTQENGPEVRLRVFGDEHYAHYEDADGYTVLYDEARGQFCYADLAGNRFVSTGVPLDQLPPEHLVRHLQESPAVRIAKREERELLHHPPEAAAFERLVQTFGPNQGLLGGRQLSIGAVRGLTILVNFQDVASATTAADVDEMANGANFTRNGNICSVREYFRRVSSGQLDYTNTVVGPYTLSRNRQHYVNNLLVPEALQLAVADGVELKQFDSRNEGIVDALNVLYAGQSLYQGVLWPHNSFIDLRFGAMRTNLYLLTGLGRDASELSIGTFCHENGHLLCRFPDMYDYGSGNREGDDQASAGIGYYCLMGAGNHLGSGRSPAPVCAYLRDLAGWCDTVVDLNTPGAYEARHGEYDTVLKFRTGKANEYFLVENRTRMGLDRAAPSSGLAVYHCDTLGSNEFQQGTPDRHYQCALLQADARKDLEDNLNQGDGSDLFGPVAGVALSSASRPHTREWDGRDSGLVLSDISVGGQQITFRVGQAVAGRRVRGERSPAADIPDNGVDGVADAISIAAPGVVRRIRVSVDIVHPYVGDLVIELFSPTRRRAVLRAREGAAAAGLVATYDSERPGELSTLVGQPMQGNWVLNVSDQEGRDVGRLQQWAIEIESASA
jgi:M6 family metalloprotease-like protein